MNSPHGFSDPPDRILCALRDAAPPPGMESRILRNLGLAATRHSAESARSRFRLPQVFRLPWIAGACTAALVIAAIAFSMHRPHPAIKSAKLVETKPSTGPNDGRPQAITVEATANPVPKRHAATAPYDAKPHLVETALSEDSQVSHPAPPVPITDQERLLLQYARRGRTGDLAEISSNRIAAKEEQERQEFLAFFKPPTPIGESE